MFPEMTALQAVIFDMDGLMVDTEPLARQVWAQVLQEHGYQLTSDLHNRMVGRRTKESAHLVLETFPLPYTADELVAYKSALWEEIWTKGVPPMPGLSRLQEALALRDVPWGVATSSPRYYAEQLLDQLGYADTCQAIAAGDEVVHGKPAPDIYLLAARRLGIAPERCLTLEDSLPGGQAAKAAGMTLVAVPNGTATATDFDFADYVFQNLGEVADQLGALMSKGGRSNGSVK